MTGYYVASLRGSRKKHGKYTVPIYARPPELVNVDLGTFMPELKGKQVWGHVSKGTLVPFTTRGEIAAGALAGRGLELLWVDDEAAGRAYLVELNVPVDGARRIMVGFYDDTYRRETEGWRFASRALTKLYAGPADLSGQFFT